MTEKEDMKALLWEIDWTIMNDDDCADALRTCAKMRLKLDEMPPELVRILRQMTGTPQVPGKD